MADFDIDLDALSEESEAIDESVEPGSPSPENVAFFVLGVAVTVGVLLSLTGVL